MENENFEIIAEEKKSLPQKIKENWKSILKVGGIIGGIGLLAGVVHRLVTTEEDDEIIIYDLDAVETDDEQEEKAD